MANPTINGDWADLTPSITAYWNPSTSTGADQSANLIAGINYAYGLGIYRYKLPLGQIRCDANLVSGIGTPINIEIFGWGETGSNPYGTAANCSILYSTGGQPIIDFGRGALYCRVRDLTLAGQGQGYANPLSPGNPIVPYLMRFSDSVGFGCGRNSCERVSFYDAIDGIRSGEPGQNGAEGFYGFTLSFVGIGNCFHQRNTQGLHNRLLHCSSRNCPTIAWIEDGGQFSLDDWALTNGADGALATAGRPTPNAATDFAVRISGNGPGANPNACVVRLSYIRSETDGTSVPGGQMISSTGDRIIEAEGFEINSPGSLAPMYSIGLGGSLLYSGGSLYYTGASLGTSDGNAPVLFSGAYFRAAPPPATGYQPDYRLCRIINGPGGWSLYDNTGVSGGSSGAGGAQGGGSPSGAVGVLILKA